MPDNCSCSGAWLVVALVLRPSLATGALSVVAPLVLRPSPAMKLVVHVTSIRLSVGHMQLCMM